jgi:ribosome maturation factor RimP
MGDAPPSIIRDLADAAAQRHDVDVLDVEVKGQGARQLVRIVVDRKGGVSVGACQALSRDLSAALDERDPIGGRYTLEVTSPGTDWPLTDQRSFDRVEGRDVVIHRRGADDRVEQVRGTVANAGADAVVLDDGTTVAYREILKAAQALPW